MRPPDTTTLALTLRATTNHSSTSQWAVAAAQPTTRDAAILAVAASRCRWAGGSVLIVASVRFRGTSHVRAYDRPTTSRDGHRRTGLALQMTAPACGRGGHMRVLSTSRAHARPARPPRTRMPMATGASSLRAARASGRRRPARYRVADVVRQKSSSSRWRVAGLAKVGAARVVL